VLGFSPRKVAEAMKTFTGLAHRSQKIAVFNGVTFVNDSKATNVNSAMMSLNAYNNIRWICGGVQKYGGLSRLNASTQMVKRAYIIGVEAESISKQLECESVICENMKKAVEQATEDSSLGDVVLLAPAASSFDQYDNFERRGEDFIFQVERVIEGAKKSKTV
jgi:UDP-N-acetylmuramoylalanine--D-glutamate ligase